jgi:Tol biopolymer transport system component
MKRAVWGQFLLLVLAGILAGCSPDPLDGVIAFQSGRDGNFEIYTMRSDGTDQRRLTSSPSNDIAPRWSPDGRSIAFASDRDGNWEIYTMHADGSEQRRLTSGQGANTAPSWSPDGAKILFVSTRDAINGEIYRMNPDGSGVERLTRDSTVKERPVMSRIGGQIAYGINHLGRQSLAILDPNNGLSTTISPGDFNSVEPTFDIYGVKVLFAADRDGVPEIYEVSKSGADLKRLTWDGLGARTPCATPSNNHILISEKGNIYLYSLKERSRKMLSFKGDSAPDWHPR